MNGKRRSPRALALLLGLALAAAGCGGGGGRVVIVDDGPRFDPNPGLALTGLWTGTFSDSYGDYTASIEIDAPDLVPAGAAGRAWISWGEESMGLRIQDGELTEVGYGRYAFAYDAVDPRTGAYVDTVTGELSLTESWLLEGSFSTTSGTSGAVSFGRNDPVAQAALGGHYELILSDAASREVIYLGEIEIDSHGNVIPGSFSYLTDDLSGPIDPGANVWPIYDGMLDLVDPATGWFEGWLDFEHPDDAIVLSGYLGTDIYVFAGTFEDRIGPGLVTLVPLD